MIRDAYFLTAADGSRYRCKKLTVHFNSETLHSFRLEFDGSQINIVKTRNIWEYHSGGDFYLDIWIQELGAQIDLAG